MAGTSTNEFIDAFLEPGDELERGGVVQYGAAAVRLVGGIELTGDAEELADFGQALVDHFRPASFALIIGDVASGHEFHGPTSPGEPAAEDKILGLTDANWAWVDLTPISKTAPAKAETPVLLTQFREHLAIAQVLQDEADRLRHTATEQGAADSDEERARAAVIDSRLAALALAEQIIRRTFGAAPRGASGPAAG